MHKTNVDNIIINIAKNIEGHWINKNVAETIITDDMNFSKKNLQIAIIVFFTTINMFAHLTIQFLLAYVVIVVSFFQCKKSSVITICYIWFLNLWVIFEA